MGWDASVLPFPALVGADDWAVELTQTEFLDFCRFAQQLSDTVVHMQGELMDEETIVCEVTSEHLWMEVRGYPHQYQLSFILLTGRRAEGNWSAAATQEVLRAIQMLQVF